MKPVVRSVILGGIGLVVLGSTIRFTRQSIWVSSGSAPLTMPQSVVLKGSAVKGAVLTSVDNQGHTLTLKIQDVELDPQDSLEEIYLYTVLYQDPATAQWQNLCQPDRNQIAKALPLSGQWDDRGDYRPQLKYKKGHRSRAPQVITDNRSRYRCSSAGISVAPSLSSNTACFAISF